MSHAAGHMSQISSMTTRPSTVLSAHTLAPVNDTSSGLLLNGAQGSELVERNQNFMHSWIPSHCRPDQRHKLSVPNQRRQINVGRTGDVCLRAPNQRHEALDDDFVSFSGLQIRPHATCAIPNIMQQQMIATQLVSRWSQVL